MGTTEGLIRDVELALDARADLGEGPTWDAAAQELIWVDITRGVVHRFDPSTERDRTIDVGQPVGAAVPTVDDRLALATRDGFALFDLETGRVESVAEVEAAISETVMNDGKCDGAGRFWAGSKDVEGRRPLGSLYRLGADLHPIRVLGGVTISNGLAWSTDQRAMYYIDSPRYAIDGFDFELETGSLSNRRELFELPRTWGLPDGMTIDEEGLLWVAFWGGSTVRRIAPDGRLATVVELPVSQVTSCAFGGGDLGDLYVTSARSGVPVTERSRQPLAGGLFRVSPGVRGLPQHPFVPPSRSDAGRTPP